MKASTVKHQPVLRVVNQNDSLLSRVDASPFDLDESAWAHVTDEVLGQNYQNGDARAFNELLRRYHQPLMRYIFRFVRSESEASDRFQEVWLKVIRSIGEYRPSQRFKTWLYTIARNECIDHLRKLKFRRHDNFDDVSESMSHLMRHEYTAERLPSQDDLVVASELQQVFIKSLETMNADQREVFLMRYEQHMPFEQIAEIIGVPVATAKSRMRYALQFLMSHMNHDQRSETSE